MSASALLERRTLDAAIGQAQKSLTQGGIPIGAALLAPDGTIVATGHNQRISHNDPQPMAKWSASVMLAEDATGTGSHS